MHADTLQELAAATAPIVAQVTTLNDVVAPTDGVPVAARITMSVSDGLDLLSGLKNYLEVARTRTGMRNDVLFQTAAAALVTQQAVNDAQQALNQNTQAQLLAIISGDNLQSQEIMQLQADALVQKARLDLVQAAGLATQSQLDANYAADAVTAAALLATKSRLTSDEQAIAALQAHDVSEAAALAANTAADQATAAQVASTQAVANQALALGQAEHAANVAQQSQLDSQAAQQALLAARQTTDEQAIAAAQTTATAALQKANDDATAASAAQAAATAAQTSATNANAAAAAAQATAAAASTAAATAQTAATAAQTTASTALQKANDDATAASNAQTTANAAQAAAASNATALAAVQADVATRLPSASVKRFTAATPGVSLVVGTPYNVPILLPTPAFSSANYLVFFTKASGSTLLNVQLGDTNKTTTGFQMTMQTTGAVTVTIAASSVEIFAILIS